MYDREYDPELFIITHKEQELLKRLRELSDEEINEKEKLAHELGHCATGSFYNEYAKCDIREKHERRANIWKIKKLIPKDKLIEVINSSFGENRWELSQYFDVTEDTMQFALDYYFA